MNACGRLGAAHEHRFGQIELAGDGLHLRAAALHPMRPQPPSFGISIGTRSRYSPSSCISSARRTGTFTSACVCDGAARGTTYRVDVPGGTLHVEWTEDDRILLTGPAVLVAEGVTDL